MANDSVNPTALAHKTSARTSQHAQSASASLLPTVPPWAAFLPGSTALLLTTLSLLCCVLPSLNAQTSVSIPAIADVSHVHQTIDHFSASDAWSMQHVGLWSETNRTRVADLLFSTNNGIGLSAWRFTLNAGFDRTITPQRRRVQSWRTAEGFLVASNQYDWSRQPGQRWFLSAAKARGVEQFIALVYSAPTNFTRNGHVYCKDGLGTSNLKPGYEAPFAAYMADVLAHFKTNAVESERVAFDYLMPVNEPFWEWNGRTQEGSRYSNEDIIRLTRALRSALDERGLETEIVLAEAGDLPGLYAVRQDISVKYGATYGNYLRAFEGITNLIARNLSAHSYFTDFPANDPAHDLVGVRRELRRHLDAQPHWRFWQSEYCILGPGGPRRDLTMRSALDVARVIWADLTIANAAAWHWWLSISESDYKDGLLYTDFLKRGDRETLYTSKILWTLGHWSRFVRPGWKRVELAGFDDVHGLMASAFVDPDANSVAMVFVNHSAKERRVKPGVKNLDTNRSVTSWSRWITSDDPAHNLAPLPAIAPEGECFIPAKSVITLIASIRRS